MPSPSIFSTVKDLERLRQIAGVLVRHGFGEFVTRSGLGALLPGASSRESTRVDTGQRLRLVLEDLGPSFVKLGQIASTRPDLLPEPIVAELRKLQNDVPPDPIDVARAIIEQELGGLVDELFVDFADTPLASASIAQVYTARLSTPEGLEDVVIKVQRPGVRAVMEADIDLLYWLARLVEHSMPEFRMYQPVKMVAEFDRSVHDELDFAQEADHAERFARNFEGDATVRFPRVFRQASSRQVLTLERFHGPKVDEAPSVGFDGKTIARLAIASVIKQVFEDGFFHADPHPGNVFVVGTPEAPALGVIDLGLVGYLSPVLRDRTLDLMVAAVRKDYQGIADALLAIGRPLKKVDRHAFENEVTVLSQKYLSKNLGELDFGSLLRDLTAGSRKFGIEVPAAFLLMGKALVTVEGIGKKLYPELDLFEETKPYFLRLVEQRYSPEKLTSDILRNLTRFGQAAQDAPIQMQEILEDLRKGSFRIQMEQIGLRALTERLSRRIFAGMVVGSAILGGAHLLAVDKPWLGGSMLAVGLVYGFLHSASVLISTRARAE